MPPSQPLKPDPSLKPVSLQVLTSSFFLEKMGVVTETGFLSCVEFCTLICPRTPNHGFTGFPN